MKRILFCTLFLTSIAFPIDGFYLGGQIGHVGLTGKTHLPSLGYSNTIGFGLDLGIRTNPILDVLLSLGYSPHGGGLSLYSQTIGANFHLWEVNDFDVTFGAGPGFYFFKTASTETDFGVHVGGAVDIRATDNLRIGLGAKWNGIFGGTIGDNFWSIAMRVGYFFGME